MRKLVLAVALLFVAVPLFAVNRTVLLVDDVIRMTKANVGDEEIIAFVRNSTTPFEVTGDDVIAMNEAKVSPAVMKFVIDESAARMKAARAEAPAQQQQPNETRVYVQHSDPVYAGPSYPTPYPYYYDPYTYYGYPYYYGYPSVSIGFGLGYSWGYPYYGGYYGYRGGHYGHGGGGYHGGHPGHGGGGGRGGHGGHGGHGGGGGHH